MSGDEGVALLVSAAVAIFGWGRWYWSTAAVAPPGGSGAGRVPLHVTPLLCIAGLYLVLGAFADAEVRANPIYQIFYMVMGAAWVVVAAMAMPLFGISPRDDALERGNDAAVIAVTGGLLGLTAAFAGSNIGDGPGWWVVVFTAGAATVVFFLAWAAVEALTGISDTITIERDIASGLRLAGFFIANGIILGRSAAGDWESFEQTTWDFLFFAWPVLVLVGLEAMMHRMLHPTIEQPHPPAALYGLVPALIYIAVGVVAVIGLGWW
jgi:uncharacterized membrane protein YjfL (UPF0719 family)